MNNARFIVFEGLDGSGKTTQLKLLLGRMTEEGIPVVTTLEPSDDNIPGLLARAVVKKSLSLESDTLALLFAADRYQHTVKFIIPYLHDGFTVLCDRYYFSNFAYQGGDIPLETLIHYNERCMALCRPDAVIFLDTPPEECARRLRENRHEKPELFEYLEYMKRTRQHYIAAFDALRDNENIFVVNSNNRTEEHISNEIWNIYQNIG